MEVFENVPRTALEVFRMLPEGTLCEVIENILYMSPAPNRAHQRLLGNIFAILAKQVQENGIGEVYIAPFDVYLVEQQSAVQPDILVVLNDNLYKIQDDGVHGAPDVIIEVLSQDKKRDLVKKKNLYEKAGVKEYFIVDPDTREITIWLMVNGFYEKQQNNEAGVFKSIILNFQFEF